MADLLTLEEYKAVAGINDDDQDAAIEFHLAAAIQAVLNYTDRDFGSEIVTEDRTYELTDGGGVVDIDDCTGVNTVSGVSAWTAESEGPAASAGIYTYLVVPSLRSSSRAMGFERNEDVFGYRAPATITVNADWGWPTVPADVKQAVAWAVDAYMGASGSESGQLAAKSVAEVAENYLQNNATTDQMTDELPKRCIGILMPYQRVTL